MDFEKLTPVAALMAIALFLFKELFAMFKKNDDKKETKIDKLIDALQHNTIAITTLTIRMEHVEKRIDLIPELERDLNKIGSKLRDITKDKNP
jgi:hypothetical protein